MILVRVVIGCPPCCSLAHKWRQFRLTMARIALRRRGRYVSLTHSSGSHQHTKAVPNMQPLDRIKAFHDEMTAWRQDLHAHPELGFEEHRTAELVAAQARGVRHARCIAASARPASSACCRSGNGAAPIGLRADMDALPIQEANDLRAPLAARTAGCTPAAMTATRRCCSARRATSPRRSNFDGTVHFIFQPAEEGLGGAEAMVEDGLFERFPCDADLRHAQPAGPRRRQLRRSAPAPMMAGGAFFDIAVDGQRRARRAARGRASIRCWSPPHHVGAAGDRGAQRAAGRHRRRQRHAHPCRRRLQRHPANAPRCAARCAPSARDAMTLIEDGHAPHRRGRRRRPRRDGRTRFPPAVRAAGQRRRRRPSSSPMPQPTLVGADNVDRNRGR